MHINRLGSVVLLLMLGLASEARGQTVVQAPPPGDDIDLGTSTLTHLEFAAGPLQAAVGVFDRVQVGTHPLPWFIGAAVPGSIVANGFAKGTLFRARGWSASLRTALFYTRLNDLDGDDLKVRAWIWPSRLMVGADWTPRLSTSLELAGVYSSVAARALVDTDTEIEGVVLARSLHAGVIPRYRIADWLSIFVRGRVLLGHSPVVARAQSRLSETSRLEVEARTNAAQLSSGFAAVGGLHLHWPFFSISAAGGYGTWFLPWIYLPVGESTGIGEIDLYFRF